MTSSVGLPRLLPNFPSFSEGLSLRDTITGAFDVVMHNFPSFSEGLSLRDEDVLQAVSARRQFPFLFGGTFIEGIPLREAPRAASIDFPSFSEGLSLRAPLFAPSAQPPGFPFLFGGTFIEGAGTTTSRKKKPYFPSFSEGLSLSA